MNLFAVLLLGGSAAAGTVEDARYLHWTGQDEVAAATLEPWLAKHPDDVEAHQLYIEIRVRGMGEGAVVSAEYASWAAPDQEVAAAVREALTRAMRGEPALVPEHPLPPILNKRWVKYLLKKWTDDPVSLRMSVDELWGLDAPIGSDADRLRKEILALVAEQAKSDDPMWLETSRSVTAAAEIPGLSTVALQRLVRNDPDAWPGAIDDVATIRVMRAARAVSRDVALERLGKLDLEDAPESDQLRHSLRGEILTAQGQKSGALEAYQKAWEASPGDAATALGFGRAALAAEASLEDAITAVRAAIRLAEQQDWTERDRADGMLWPEAYTRILADRKVDLGHLQDVLRKLNRATGARTPEVRQPAPAGQSEDHLAAGLDRDDRFGTRHLVQAIRLAQLEGNAEVVSQAKARLKRNEAWFLGGLDARVKGWNNAVGQPEDLRPVAGERVGESIAGEPLTDFELDIDGATTRLTELGGLRVLAAFAPNCDACTGFLREVDELARKYQSAGRFIAVDISGDDRSVDKLMKNADVAFEVANTSGDLPQDFAGGGVPRLYIVSSEGVVIGDSGHRPSAQTMWRTLGKALTDVAFESAGAESTPPGLLPCVIRPSAKGIQSGAFSTT